MSAKSPDLPAWEALLSSAARLQSIVPGAVMVGGSASAMHVGHRLSQDHDHVVGDLKDHFDGVLRDLEATAGWQTARVSRPVLILGSLDGIQTGVRQLIRSAPLETEEIAHASIRVIVPTLPETFRVKGWLILRRNATRDYVDFAALGEGLGGQGCAEALAPMDALYPQEAGESPLQQLLAQLASPLPYDLRGTDLSRYKGLQQKWHQWEAVAEFCGSLASDLMVRLAKAHDNENDGPAP